jgi:hypothetical protein
MSIPPDTTNYMIAGYAVFFIVTIAYVCSLTLRWINLKRDIQMLDELGKDKNP